MNASDVLIEFKRSVRRSDPSSTQHVLRRGGVQHLDSIEAQCGFLRSKRNAPQRDVPQRYDCRFALYSNSTSSLII